MNMTEILDCLFNRGGSVCTDDMERSLNIIYYESIYLPFQNFI